jgi:hypothetical protein
MANFALIDTKGRVLQTTFVPNEHESDGNTYLNSLGLSGTWIQTSFNTRAGVHYTQYPVLSAGVVVHYYAVPDEGTPLRKNYALPGFVYDATRDAFIAAKPIYPSWVLNETNGMWIPPVEYPNDGGYYTWNESTTSWTYVMPMSAYARQVGM